MERHGRRAPGWVVGLAAALAVFSTGAEGSYISSDQRIEAASTIETQNTLHHDSANDIDWVQFRNEFRFDFRYFLWDPERALGPFSAARFSILYRARYDAVYDLLEKYKDLGYRRDDFRFPEGKVPRELFLDLGMAPPFDRFSFRIGRQQVVWGEADLFRSLDVINPLRLDQNGIIGEDFDEYREPLWIAKGLVSLGPVPYIAENSFLEYFYSPNWRPLTDRIIVSEGFRIGVDTNNALTGFKRPTHLPFRQVRHPWEVSRVGQLHTDAPDYADISPEGPQCEPNSADPLRSGCGDFVYLINNGVPTSVVDLDASMFGIRFGGQTFAGLDFTINYLFKRTEVPGTALRVDDLFCREGDPDGPLCNERGDPNPRGSLLAQAVAAAATSDSDGDGITDGNEELMERCIFGFEPVIVLDSMHGPRSPQLIPGGATGVENAFTGCELVGFWYPWTHILGGTLTYNDNRFTGFIWRLEQSYSTKEPRNGEPPLAAQRRGQYPTTRDFDTHGKRDTQIWRSMIGFDYLRTIWSKPPNWIRGRKWLSTWFTDQWFFTVQYLHEYYAHADHQWALLDSATDRMQHWNPVITFAMTGFFMNQKLRPFWAYGYDVNGQHHVLWLQWQYFLTPKVAIRFGDIMYMGSYHDESFIFLHKYADRDNLFFRLTYFLI